VGWGGEKCDHSMRKRGGLYWKRGGEKLYVRAGASGAGGASGDQRHRLCDAGWVKDDWQQQMKTPFTWFLLFHRWCQSNHLKHLRLRKLTFTGYNNKRGEKKRKTSLQGGGRREIKETSRGVQELGSKWVLHKNYKGRQNRKRIQTHARGKVVWDWG